jgi:hypothetical protein
MGAGSTGGYCVVLAELSRGAQTPFTASDKGAAQVMRM